MSTATLCPACAKRRRSIATLRIDRRGGSLVEYLVIVGLVALAALGAFRAFGNQIETKVECQAAVIAGGAGCGAADRAADGSGNYALVTQDDVPITLTAGEAKRDNPLLVALKQFGGFFGGLAYAVKDDAVGLWNLVTDPWGTLKDAGTGIFDRIKSRAESDAVKVVDQWKRGDYWGAAWTVTKGVWSSTSGLAIDTFVIDEGVKEDWRNGNYGGAVGRVTWNVGSWFIPGAGWALRGGKGITTASRAAKVTKADEIAKAAKAEEAAKAAKAEEAAKAAEEAAAKNTPRGASGATIAPDVAKGGRLSMDDVMDIVPEGTPNTWNPGKFGSDGYTGPGFRYEWTAADGTKYRVWGHDANPNAPSGTNAANGPTVRIQIGNRYATTRGETVRNVDGNSPVGVANANDSHIPLDNYRQP